MEIMSRNRSVPNLSRDRPSSSLRSPTNSVANGLSSSSLRSPSRAGGGRLPPLELEKLSGSNLGSSRSEPNFHEGFCPLSLILASVPRNQHRALRCPGALAWLQRQPAVDEDRLEIWLKGKTPTERGLRRALRRPLSDAKHETASSKTHLGATAEVSLLKQLLAGEAKPSGRPNRGEEHLAADSPLMVAATKRLARLQDLLDREGPNSPAGSRLGSRLGSPLVSVQRLEALWDEPPGFAPPPTETSTLMPSTLLSTWPSTCSLTSSGLTLPLLPGESRGLRGLAEPRSGFRQLRDNRNSKAFSRGAFTETIAPYLVRHAKTDEQKAFAIFSWICQALARKPEDDPEAKDDAEDALAGRGAASRGLAEVFLGLCREVDLTVTVLSGHLIDCENQTPTATSWNAVLLGRDWVFVDCASGMGFLDPSAPKGFQREFRPYFFGPLEGEWSLSHVPAPAGVEARSIAVPDEARLRPRITADVFCGLNLELPPLEPGKPVSIRVPSNVELEARLDGDPWACFVASGALRTVLEVTVLCGRNLHTLPGCKKSTHLIAVLSVVGHDEIIHRTGPIGEPGTRVQNRTMKRPFLPGGTILLSLHAESSPGDGNPLGQVTINTDAFHAGHEVFDAWLPVTHQHRGIERHKTLPAMSVKPVGVAELHLQVMHRGVEASAPSNGEPDMKLVYIRPPPASEACSMQLELRAKKRSSNNEFRPACCIELPPLEDTVLETHPDLPKVAPLFPKPDLGVMAAFHIEFNDALPAGQFLCSHVEADKQAQDRQKVPKSKTSTAAFSGALGGVEKVLAKLKLHDPDVHVHLELEPPDEQESLFVRRKGDQVLLVATLPYPAADEYLVHLLAHRGKMNEEEEATRFLTYHLSVEGRVKFDMQEEVETAPEEEHEEPDRPEEAAPA